MYLWTTVEICICFRIVFSISQIYHFVEILIVILINDIKRSSNKPHKYSPIMVTMHEFNFGFNLF